MWEVRNGTPFEAAGTFVRDAEGFEHWVIAVRARFALRRTARFPVLEEQAPVRLVPDYADEQSRELAADADIAPFRPRPDIVVRGTVQPPEDGAPARPLRLRLGALEKRLRAHGPRHVRRDKGRWLVERQPFAPFPLSWTRSLGGADVLEGGDGPHPANPIGCGWSPRLAQAPDGAGFFLPQLEAPAAPVHPGRPLPDPAGFGAVQPGWQPRAGRAGTYDAAWENGRAPLAPADFSPAFFQAAPDDQVYEGELRGGEPGEVDGLHPDGPLRFTVPQILLDARTRLGVGTVDTRLRLIGLEIDGTAGTLDMIWNAHVPCPDSDHLLRHSFVFLTQMSGVER